MRLLFLICLSALWATAAASHETRAFDRSFNAICALGESQSQGCDAIRARAVMDAQSDDLSAIGRVNFAGTYVKSHCTGTAISPHLVLTARHCVFPLGRNVAIPASSLNFLSGYQKGTFNAHGRGLGYVTPDQGDLDWVLIELDRPMPTFALAQGSGIGQDAHMLGYASARAHVLSQSDCGVLHAGANGLLYARCMAMQGDSGAPILVEENGEQRLVGVLSRLIVDESGAVISEIIPVSLIKAALD